MGQHQGEGQHPQDRAPDHHLAPQAVAHRPADQGSRRHRAQEDGQIDLRLPHRKLEGLHQIEGVIAGQAGHVDVLGKHQHRQKTQGDQHLAARQDHLRDRSGGLFRGLGAGLAVPQADPPQHHRGDQRGGGKPRHRGLPIRHHDQRRQQRAEGGAGIAAHLEHRLRQTEAPARGHAGDSRRLGVEDRRPHPQHQGKRLGVLVGVEADPGLQQRRG